MARTRTLLELRTECRQRTEMEGSTFVSDVELTRYLNQSIAKLHSKLVRAYGDQYYRTASSVSTVANTDTVVLPTTFFKLLGVDVLIGGITQAIEPLDWSRRAEYANVGAVWTSGYPIAYSLGASGGKLQFFPTPSGVYTVTIHYLPYSTVLTSDADTYDGNSGWEHYVVLDTCISMLAKEESDTRDLRLERDDIEKQIDEIAGNRDEGAAWRVQRRWSPRGAGRARGRGW
jgi:hypothetical protein